jgi:hypothetical protein
VGGWLGEIDIETDSVQLELELSLETTKDILSQTFFIFLPTLSKCFIALGPDIGKVFWSPRIKFTWKS